LAVSSAPEPLTRNGGVLRYRRAQWLYRYDTTFRKEALFDAVADERETKDVSGEHPDMVEDLRAAFLRHLKRHRLEDLPSGDEEWRKALEGVGYVGGSSEDR
ncbi:MAG: hypothetical protein ACYTG4_16095, partial [Planctomycetota bacterium]